MRILFSTASINIFQNIKLYELSLQMHNVGKEISGRKQLKSSRQNYDVMHYG